MFSRTKGIATLALALTLSLAACDDGTGTGEGSLTLMLTDAPGDVAAAYVTIDRIYLQPGSEEESDGEGDMDGRGLSRVDLMTDVYTQDLLELANDIEELVADVPVPEGFYEQLRVVVSQACIAVETDAGDYNVYTTDTAFTECELDADIADNINLVGDLQEASTDRTGIKVILPDGGLQVTGGSQQILLLDFDVSESFGHPTGQPDKWVLHPVVKGSEIGLTSSITVTVDAAEGVELPVIDEVQLTFGDFAADLSTEEADQAFEDVDGVWTATFAALVPEAGVEPVVTIVPPTTAEGFTFTFEPTSEAVTLVSGQDAPVAFTLTEVTAPAQ